jgi:copper(I)-binding protein
MFRRRTFLLFATGACALSALAQQIEPGTLVISRPWSRPTVQGMPMGVAYLSITNNGKTADVLTGASSPAAARVEIHQTTFADGMARMRSVTDVTIAPGATVKFEPGGIHLMLVDLKAPLETGKPVPLELHFRSAGKISVVLNVEAQQK